MSKREHDVSLEKALRLQLSRHACSSYPNPNQKKHMPSTRVHVEYMQDGEGSKWPPIHKAQEQLPEKLKQRSSKSLQTTSLCYCNAKSTLKVLLIFNKVDKTNVENLDFIHLVPSSSSSFFLAKHNSKRIQSQQILNIPNDCSANLLHSSLF